MILKEMHYTMNVIPDEDYKLVEGEYKGHKYLAVNASGNLTRFASGF